MAISCSTATCVLLATFKRATWVKYGEGQITGTSHYCDPGSITKRGDLRRVWEIQDLEQPHKEGELSRRFLWEYDCKAEQAHILSGTSHSGHMAGGDRLASAAVTEWRDVPSGTIVAAMLEIDCQYHQSAVGPSLTAGFSLMRFATLQ